MNTLSVGADRVEEGCWRSGSDGASSLEATSTRIAGAGDTLGIRAARHEDPVAVSRARTRSLTHAQHARRGEKNAAGWSGGTTSSPTKRQGPGGTSPRRGGRVGRREGTHRFSSSSCPCSAPPHGGECHPARWTGKEVEDGACQAGTRRGTHTSGNPRVRGGENPRPGFSLPAGGMAGFFQPENE